MGREQQDLGDSQKFKQYRKLSNAIKNETIPHMLYQDMTPNRPSLRELSTPEQICSSSTKPESEGRREKPPLSAKKPRRIDGEWVTELKQTLEKAATQKPLVSTLEAAFDTLARCL